MRPLRLTDDQLSALWRAAEPLHVQDRGAFLQAVAEALRGQELGDGAVFRAIREAQRKFYDAPISLFGSSWGRGI